MRINGSFVQTNLRTNSMRYMMAPDRAIGGTGGRTDSPLLKVTEGMIKQTGWKTDPPFDKEIVNYGDQRKFLRECRDEYDLFEAQKVPDEYLSGLLSRALKGRNDSLHQDTEALTLAVAGEMAADLIQPYSYHCSAVSLFTGLGNGNRVLNSFPPLDMPKLKASALCHAYLQSYTAKAATLLFSLEEGISLPIILKMKEHYSGRLRELTEELNRMIGVPAE